MSDTTTALAIRRPTSISGYQPPPEKAEFAAMIEMANMLAKAPGFVPEHFIGQPYKILAAILYGRDLGITPTNALQHIIVIEGKAGADAQLIGMLVRRAGHKLEDATTDASSTVKITRGDDGTVHTATFGMADAQRITIKTKDGHKKLAEQPAYRNYPRGMFYSRALTECARKGAQDALMGVAYTPEELEPTGMTINQSTDGGFTGEIPIDQATPASLAAMAGVSEATTVSPPFDAAIQPTPPAPSVEVPEPPGATQASAAEVAAAPTPPPPQTPANAAPVAPLAGANVSRRLGPGRSISPVRRNVTTVQPPQAAEKPTTASADAQPQVGPAEPILAQPAPPALTDEADLPEPVDPGKQVYLNQLRGDLRVQTAVLFRVNALLDNVKRGLEGKEPSEVPPATPSEASDQALASRIDTDWPGRKLDNLGEAELAALTERFEANLARKRAVLKERGISGE